MKLKSFLLSPFCVNYRLTLSQGGVYKNIYGCDRKLLLRRAKSTKCGHWSLYKSGPFFLPERQVDGSNSD